MKRLARHLLQLLILVAVIGAAGGGWMWWQARSKVPVAERYEFEEASLNKQLGYTSPAALVDLYPRFYWDSAFPLIQPAIRYLNVTSSGRQWIANLYGNVYRAEYDPNLLGTKQ